MGIKIKRLLNKPLFYCNLNNILDIITTEAHKKSNILKIFPKRRTLMNKLYFNLLTVKEILLTHSLITSIRFLMELRQD